MDINFENVMQTHANNYTLKTREVAIPEESVQRPNSINKSEASKPESKAGEQHQEELSREEIDKLTEHLNKFMKAINAELEFDLHDDTKRLMVRFVDQKDGQVIKEFPPRELLDTLAAIRDYVGVLLDKKV